MTKYLCICSMEPKWWHSGPMEDGIAVQLPNSISRQNTQLWSTTRVKRTSTTSTTSKYLNVHPETVQCFCLRLRITFTTHRSNYCVLAECGQTQHRDTDPADTLRISCFVASFTHYVTSVSYFEYYITRFHSLQHYRRAAIVFFKCGYRESDLQHSQLCQTCPSQNIEDMPCQPKTHTWSKLAIRRLVRMLLTLLHNNLTKIALDRS